MSLYEYFRFTDLNDDCVILALIQINSLSKEGTDPSLLMK